MNSGSEEEAMNDIDDDVSIKSFSSTSFEPDFSDIKNKDKQQHKRDYMKEYMRDYRLKQKLKQEERSQLTKVRNQLVSEKDAERVLLNALSRLILLLNDKTIRIILSFNFVRIIFNKYLCFF